MAPGLWAYDDQIPKPSRGVAAATALIEAAGWARGTDGVYAKGGKRLAAQGDFGPDLSAIGVWPNHAPRTDRPFDLYFYAWGAGWDPLSDNFSSAAITTETQDFGDNFGGYSDPRIDDLLTRMETTYDLATRADLFRQYQEILAEQQPALFAWFTRRAEAAAAGLRTFRRTDRPRSAALVCVPEPARAPGGGRFLTRGQKPWVAASVARSGKRMLRLRAAEVAADP